MANLLKILCQSLTIFGIISRGYECLSLAKDSFSLMTSVVCMKRKGGVIVQDCDVYIGRSCYMGGWKLQASKWANPFTIKQCGSAEEAIRRYEEYLLGKPELLAEIPSLKNKRLGCWCKKKGHEPCHGDVLKRLADSC